MKLHLPKLLLATVLACVVAGDALADYTASNGIVTDLGTSTKTETVNGSAVTQTDGSKLIVFDIAKPSSDMYWNIGNGTGNDATDQTLTCNVQIGSSGAANDTNGLWTRNSYGTTTNIKFLGSVTGTGTIGRLTAGQGMTYSFLGDISGFTGNFVCETNNASGSNAAIIWNINFGTDGAETNPTSVNADTMAYTGDNITGTANITAKSGEAHVTFGYTSTGTLDIANAITTDGGIVSLATNSGANYNFTQGVKVSSLAAASSEVTFGAGLNVSGATTAHTLNLTGGESTLAGSKAITNLEVSGGTLTVSGTGTVTNTVINGGEVKLTTSAAAAALSGDVAVNAGATLSLGYDSLGWGDSRTKKISLLGSDKAVATLKSTGTASTTLETALELKGDTLVTGTGSFNTFRSDTNNDGVAAHPEDSIISVSGNNNTFEMQLDVRGPLKIDVAKEGSLDFTGKLTTSGQAGGDQTKSITKTGAGELNISNTTNSYTGSVSVDGGTLRLKDGAKVTTEQTVDEEDAIKVNAGGTLAYNGDNTSSSNVTLNGSGKVVVEKGVLTLSGASISGTDVTVSSLPTFAAGDATLENVTISNRGIEGGTKGGSIENATVTMSGNANKTISDVTLENTVLDINLTDGATLEMTDVVFGSNVTGTENLTLSQDSSTTVRLTATDVQNALDNDTLTFSAAGVELTCDGLAQINFGTSNVTLDLTLDFLQALQRVVMPDCTDKLVLTFGEGVDLSSATIAVNANYLTASATAAGNVVTVDFSPTTDAIPEPATAALSLLALAGLAARRRRKH